MGLWIWAVLLLLVGMTLVAMDVFLPSGGIFAFLAVCAIVGAIWLGFTEGSGVALGVLAGAIAGTIAVVIAAFRYWPSTSLGRRMLLQVPSGEDVLPENMLRKTLEGLVGHTGRAKSAMLPSGIIAVDGVSYDAMSEGPPVEAGQKVRVIEVRGNRLVVRGLADDPPGSEPENDPLSQPVDWDSPDPFRPSVA